MGLAAARRLKQSAFESFYLNNLSSIHFTLGNYEEALARGDEALSVGFELEGLDKTILLCNFGDPYIQTGEVLLITERTDAFYRLFDLLHRKIGVAGAALQDTDDEAADLARQEIDMAFASVQRFVQSGDKAGEAKALANLASGYTRLGNYQRAIERYLQALEISQGLGDQRSRPVIQGILGWLFAALGETAKSIELLAEALAACRKIKDDRGEYLALGSLGAVHAIRCEHDRALDFFRQAREVARALKDVNAENMILSHINLIEPKLAGQS
jgi:tetratricopeptide (TPR) repeat protein